MFVQKVDDKAQKAQQQNNEPQHFIFGDYSVIWMYEKKKYFVADIAVYIS